MIRNNMIRKSLMSSVVALTVATGLPVNAAWEALPDVVPTPEDNSTAEAKVTLGKMSYYVSCCYIA